LEEVNVELAAQNAGCLCSRTATEKFEDLDAKQEEVEKLRQTEVGLLFSFSLCKVDDISILGRNLQILKTKRGRGSMINSQPKEIKCVFRSCY